MKRAALCCGAVLATLCTLRAATFSVTTIDDSGPGSLRQAILQANAAPDEDRIEFQIPGAGPFTIRPSSSLPIISSLVTIDGTTQPGFAGQPIVELNGADAGYAADGLALGQTAGAPRGCTIRGLAINRFSNNGIVSAGSGYNHIEGNFIGTDITGTVARPNQRFGILVFDGFNTIGGTTTAARNVISGNAQSGIDIDNLSTAARANLVLGNYIGVDVTGTNRLGNGQSGILIYNANQNVIGGTADGARNIISGNGMSGVEVAGGALGNVLQGNWIGIDAMGKRDCGNLLAGILISSASSNIVGGTALAARNVISANGLCGIEIINFASQGNVVEGNFIGTDANGKVALGNSGGLLIDRDARDTRIGGTNSGAGNVIAGSRYFSGVNIRGAATGTIVQGNRIGTDFSGKVALGNAGAGVLLNQGGQRTLIGGTAPGAGNLLSGNLAAGVELSDSGTRSNVVEGNLIGTDLSGTAALPNNSGVLIDVLASENRIGGFTSASRNVISGNGIQGVTIRGGATSNTVQGNFIGTDATGRTALANIQTGVLIESPFNLLGPGNVISGNQLHGVEMRFRGCVSNRVEGNLIGTDLEGRNILGNGVDGVLLDLGASHNTIGGTNELQRNLVSGNGVCGISLESAETVSNRVEGNFIGTDFTGTIALGNGEDGVFLLESRDNVLGGAIPGARNIISGNGRLGRPNDGRSGIEIWTGASDNRIQGNYIGTDVTGTRALPNREYGIFIQASPRNIIGGVEPGMGNLISGNVLDGIFLEQVDATQNWILGNRIGTECTGTAPLPNGGHGIRLVDAPHNLLGGPEASGRNVISANALDGVLIDGPAAAGTRVVNAYIGTDVNGTAPLGNTGSGIHLVNGAHQNFLGSGNPTERNLISGNLAHGIHIEHAESTENHVQGNLIGTDLTGTNALGNAGSGIRTSRGASGNRFGDSAWAPNIIAFNQAHGVHLRDGAQNLVRNSAIFSNGGLGINLGIDTVTANDPGDLDTGANQLQNFPVLSSAVGNTDGTIALTGILDSQPNTVFILEFFANPQGDPSGHGEGAILLGLLPVTTDTGGRGEFTANFTNQIPVGWFISATATDPALNTSEFSAGRELLSQGVLTRPRLEKTVAANRLNLSWTDARCVLECATNLLQPVFWSPATNRVEQVNGRFEVRVEASSGNQFFRLSME